MALNLTLPMRPSMANLGSFKKSETQVFGASRRAPSERNESKGSRLNIRCWKGHVVPPPSVLEGVLNGVQPKVIPKPKTVTRNDFPPDFMFGCSTSALQVSLYLLL